MGHVAVGLVDVERAAGRMQAAAHGARAIAAHGLDAHASRFDVIYDALQGGAGGRGDTDGDAAAGPDDIAAGIQWGPGPSMVATAGLSPVMRGGGCRLITRANPVATELRHGACTRVAGPGDDGEDDGHNREKPKVTLDNGPADQAVA